MPRQGAPQCNNRFYAIQSRQEAVETLDVVTGMLTVFVLDICVLLDSVANLSFITPYIAVKFDRNPEVLSSLFSVCTPVAESILKKRVYRNCPVSVLQKVILCDLVDLDMVDFNIILEMDWLYTAYATVDYRTCRVKF